MIHIFFMVYMCSLSCILILNEYITCQCDSSILRYKYNSKRMNHFVCMVRQNLSNCNLFHSANMFQCSSPDCQAELEVGITSGSRISLCIFIDNEIFCYFKICILK